MRYPITIPYPAWEKEVAEMSQTGNTAYIPNGLYWRPPSHPPLAFRKKEPPFSIFSEKGDNRVLNLLQSTPVQSVEPTGLQTETPIYVGCFKLPKFLPYTTRLLLRRTLHGDAYGCMHASLVPRTLRIYRPLHLHCA